nr:DNA-directed RNA polymerase III subunit [Scale drop disease virus]
MRDLYTLEECYELQCKNQFTKLKSSGHVCTKCKSNKTFMVTRQTRSADEALSVFVKCVKCSNQWQI